MFTSELIKLNEDTMEYHLPLDGILSFGTMFILYEMDVDTLYILLIGALIHGVVHPIITIPK